MTPLPMTTTHPRSATRRGVCCRGAAWLAAPLLAACGGGNSHTLSRDDEPRTAVPAPARFALVLSGGGLRGFAHLGVLRALQRLGAEPDLIVGSSVGAVIGGLYASGTALDAVERLALAPEMDPWSSWFVSPQSRSAGLGVFMRGALAQRRMEDFPRRFAAVATARDSGIACAFGRGDAVCAILASSALPGALAPMAIDGREYVDGGLSQPLPVRLARMLGAQHVVAVDVGFHPEVPAPVGRIGSVFHAGFLMARNLSAPDRAQADVVIEPVLPSVPDVTLANRAALIDCGERAAMALAPTLHASLGAAMLAQGGAR